MGNHQHIENSGNSLKERVLKVSAAFSVPAGITRIEAWQTLERRIADVVPHGNEISFDFTFYLKIAASLLFMALAAFTVYNFQQVELLTAKGEHQIITLPDHSTVMLNAGSALQYNALLFAFTRKVNFNGEAFFTIQKGSKFQVVSQHGVVKVLGTQFNVISRKAIYEVACVEGKVRVSNSANTSGVILTAGLQTALSHKNLKEPTLFKSELMAWKNGEFYFENAVLQEVLNTLEIQYDITIHFDGATARSYTGYFTNNNLEESLKLICLPLELEYKILNKKEVKITTKK